MSTDTLQVAAQNNDIDSIYRVIEQDSPVLDRIDSVSFVETPWHVAASLGHLQFAIEIMILEPSFAIKLNLQGLTPIHLAVEHGQREMLLRFVEINKDLVRVKGRKSLTPLHLASQRGEAELLGEFLMACPNSIEDVTARRETALHIAVTNGHFGALQVLFYCLLENHGSNAVRTILNWKDEEGNTVLHIAAFYNDIEVGWINNWAFKHGNSVDDISMENSSFHYCTIKLSSTSCIQVVDSPGFRFILMYSSTSCDFIYT